MKENAFPDCYLPEAPLPVHILESIEVVKISSLNTNDYVQKIENLHSDIKKLRKEVEELKHEINTKKL